MIAEEDEEDVVDEEEDRFTGKTASIASEIMCKRALLSFSRLLARSRRSRNLSKCCRKVRIRISARRLLSTSFVLSRSLTKPVLDKKSVNGGGASGSTDAWSSMPSTPPAAVLFFAAAAASANIFAAATEGTEDAPFE